MPFKTAFRYEDEIYMLEFTPRMEGNHMANIVVLGSELSMARRTFEMVSTDLPGAEKMYWTLDIAATGGKPINQRFIDAIGYAIEQYHK